MNEAIAPGMLYFNHRASETESLAEEIVATYKREDTEEGR